MTNYEKELQSMNVDLLASCYSNLVESCDECMIYNFCKNVDRKAIAEKYDIQHKDEIDCYEVWKYWLEREVKENEK